MPQSYSYAFSDPYALAAAVRGSSNEVMLTAKGDFHGELTIIDLDRLGMLRSAMSVPALVRTAITSQRAAILFLSDSQQGPYRYGSKEVLPGEILIYGRNANDHLRTGANLRAAAMSLTHEDLAAATRAIAGRELVFPSGNQVVRPAHASMSHLQALHETVGKLAKAAPSLLANPAVAIALEQELVHAMVRVLTDHESSDLPSDSARNLKVISRFEEFLSERQHEPLYLGQICAAVGASERILRASCKEHLGVGPVHYLWLRRMNLARRALLCAEAGKTSVTEVATDHGFWELGRFSMEYRALFGEKPSATLQRPPQQGYRDAGPKRVGVAKTAKVMAG